MSHLGVESTTPIKLYCRWINKFDGSKLASGIYILTMQVNDFYKSQKLLLTK